MQPLDYAKLVDVPAATLSAFQAQLTAAAGTVGHATLADAFTKLAAATLPVDERYLGSVRWVREWSRRNAVVYGALGTAAQNVLDQATGFPFLVRDDAGTVAHVWFDGAQLHDSKGNAWTMNGSVPQVAATEHAPPGAGPFVNNVGYSLGAGADVLDFAGDFSLVVVFSALAAPPFPFFPGLFVDGTVGGGGYEIFVRASDGAAVIRTKGIGGADVGAANGVLAGLNVACFGRSGGNSCVQLNLGAFVSLAVAYATDATSIAKIGFGGEAQSGLIVIHEMEASSAALTNALATQAANDVKRQLGITAW